MDHNFSIYQLYQQLRGVSLSDALTAFDNLIENELNYEVADRYFGAFGVGNVVQVVNAPHERFICYEFLLTMLRQKNITKFEKMHKGTPYYFLAWTAFDIRDYERAIYYLDAALAEDIRLWPGQWMNTPIGMILTLQDGGTAIRIIQEIRGKFNEIISQLFTDVQITIDIRTFIEKFVLAVINQDKKNRSIVTSLYSFILEFYDREAMLLLRSSERGTIEPFLMHLLKGVVIFETLIKEVAQKNSWKMDSGSQRGSDIKTLGNLDYCSAFTSKYCRLQDQDTVHNIQDVLNLISKNDLETAINVTYLLRNKVSHDLRWDDIFDNPINYEKLFRQIINAILIVIHKEFLV